MFVFKLKYWNECLYISVRVILFKGKNRGGRDGEGACGTRMDSLQDW